MKCSPYFSRVLKAALIGFSGMGTAGALSGCVVREREEAYPVGYYDGDHREHDRYYDHHDDRDREREREHEEHREAYRDRD